MVHKYIDYAVNNIGDVYAIDINGRLHEIIGCNHKGYLNIWYKGKMILKHRFIYEQFYNIKLTPDQHINHIDFNRKNNNISNLEIVTNQENSMHKKKRADNKSGHKNVSWIEHIKKWQVNIHHNNKHIHIAYTNNINHAILLRNMFIRYYNNTYNTRFLISD